MQKFMDSAVNITFTDKNASRAGSSSQSSQAESRTTSQHVPLRGDVRIEMDRHDPVHATQIVATVKECLWLDHSGRPVLRHSFSKALYTYFPWRHVSQHAVHTVAFDDHEMHGCEAICSIPGHAAHRRSMPVYIFSNAEDYQSFQSLTRGAFFLRDYETQSVKCKAKDTQSSDRICVKAWRSLADSAERSFTLPITVRVHEGYRLTHVSLLAHWMNYEKQDANIVRLEFKQGHKKESSTSVPGSSKRSIAWKYSWSKSQMIEEPVTQMSRGLNDTAPAEVRRKWQSFILQFKNQISRDQFYDDHRVIAVPGDLPRRVSASIAVTEQNTSSLKHQSLTMPARSASSSAHSGDAQTATEIWNPQEAIASIDASVHPGAEPITHDYMRVGGPKEMSRVVVASLDSSHTNVHFHRKLSNNLREFRLLRIQRGTGPTVAGHLDHHILSASPKYEAVSYCWGHGARTSTISIDGRDGFRVSMHLWHALCRFRLPNRDRLVWIDAVCINQTDVDERNHQTALMRRIYATAFRTIIWIGELRPMQATCSRGFEDDQDRDLTLCVKPGLAEAEHGNAVEDIRQDLRQLQQQHDTNDRADIWWRRLWCVQEFHFSKRSPTVYIGPHAVKWVHFYSLFDSAAHALEPFQNLQKMMPDSLTHLLSMTGSFHCSDPRDRVFALLGMVRQSGATLVPDYRRSVIRVLEDACFHLILESQSIDVLLDGRTARSSWGREGLLNIIPTWIPDLTCLIGSRVMLDAHRNNAGLVHDTVPQLPVVELSSGPSPLFSVDADYDLPRMLRFRAVQFDTIDRRTTFEDIPAHEQSPGGSLIYNSLRKRGHVIDQILNKLQYSFHEHKSRSKHDLDVNPSIGRLMLDYLLEGQRSYVEELERRSLPPERDILTSYERQEADDLEYLKHESKYRDTAEDVQYVRDRWHLKTSRAAAKERFVPTRLEPALASGNIKIEQDFLVARDLGNLFAYARRTKDRFYLNTGNFDAPMRRDVLQCSSLAEVKRLKSQYDSQAKDLEIHEYSAKCRERDFFKTKTGFIGLGPACLEVGDEIVIPFGASRPFIIRKSTELGLYHTLVGEAVVPGIMSGKWTRHERESWTDYKIK